MLDSAKNYQVMANARKHNVSPNQMLATVGAASNAGYSKMWFSDQSPRMSGLRMVRHRNRPSFRTIIYLILASSCIFLSACATDLHVVVRIGNVDQVKRLLERGRDPNAIDQRGETPLCWAAEDGRTPIVKLLLEKGANPNLIVKYGVFRYRPDIQDTNAATPLMLAAIGGHLETVKLLLSARADPNLRGPLGVTALDSAIRNKHGDVALLLLDSGANPNPKLQLVGGLNFMTPLEGAITNEDVELTEALLNKGASVTDVSTKLLKEKCNGGFTGVLIQRDPRFEWLQKCQTQSWLSKFRQRF